MIHNSTVEGFFVEQLLPFIADRWLPRNLKIS